MAQTTAYMVIVNIYMYMNIMKNALFNNSTKLKSAKFHTIIYPPGENYIKTTTTNVINLYIPVLFILEA